MVEECGVDGSAVLSQRNKFYRGDELELLIPGKKPVKFTVDKMFSADGEEIEDTRHAMMEIHTSLPVCAPKYSVIRKYRNT